MTVTLAQAPSVQATPIFARSIRLDALDNLRSFTIVLVVVFHAAMSYMLFAPSWWYVVDSKQSLGFFCFVMICRRLHHAGDVPAGRLLWIALAVA